MSMLLSQLDGLAAAGNQKALAFLTKPMRGQRQTLIPEFMQTLRRRRTRSSFDPFDDQVLRHANARSFGHDQLPTFDIAHSRYVISFGADFLGTWNAAVPQSVGYGEMRQGKPGQRGKFVQVEARMSQTGANADEWVPVNPGTEGVLALGMAHVIREIRNCGRAMRPDWRDTHRRKFRKAHRREGRSHRTTRTGVRGERSGRCDHRRHASGAHQWHVQRARGECAQCARTWGNRRRFVHAAAEECPSGDAYAVRRNWRLRNLPSRCFFCTMRIRCMDRHRRGAYAKHLSKIPFIASFGSFIDETSILADLILPDHSFLESWVDDIPESGAGVAVASVAPPAMHPIHQTRAMPDVLLDVSHRLAKPLSAGASLENV